MLCALFHTYGMDKTQRVVCQECGRDYNHRKTLMQHVKVLHKMKFDDYNRKHGLEQRQCHCGNTLPEQRRAEHGGGRTRKHCSPECNAMANSLRRNYGIEPDVYWQSIRKGCEICGSEISIAGRKLAVDHSHSTGKFRGVLCANCNTGLGMFRDSPDLLKKAVEYLQR